MAPSQAARHTFHRIVLILLFAGIVIPRGVQAAPGGPDESRLPKLSEFKSAVADGRAGVLRGVYAQGLFALPVVQQPYASFVSREPETVTQFGTAAMFGVFGLLAHNDLTGKDFFELRPGERVDLVFGDGSIETYWVTRVLRYRATEPQSMYSGFVDLDTGEGLNSETLFDKVYRGPAHVTFQTCIANGGLLTWGRLFVIAEKEPAVSPQPRLTALRDRDE